MFYTKCANCADAARCPNCKTVKKQLTADELRHVEKATWMEIIKRQPSLLTELTWEELSELED